MTWQRTLSELQQQARQQQQDGHTEDAAQTFKQALDLLHEEEPGGVESVQAELALRTDYGNLLRQMTSLEEATVQFQAALAALQTVDAADLELPRLGTTLQLASLLLDQQRHEDARALLADVTAEQIEALSDDQARSFMRVDYSRLQGTIAHAEGKGADAAAYWLKAMEDAEKLLEIHPPAATMYVRQFVEQLIGNAPERLPTSGWEDALSSTDRVQSALEQHVNSGAEGADSQFIRLEVLRAELARRAGHMSQAEDAIWRAIDMEKSWMSLLGGMGLYSRLIVEPDHALQAGNLPREEVQSGAADLIAQLSAGSTELVDGPTFLALMHIWLEWLPSDRVVAELETKLEGLSVNGESSPQVQTVFRIVQGALNLVK